MDTDKLIACDSKVRVEAAFLPIEFANVSRDGTLVAWVEDAGLPSEEPLDTVALFDEDQGKITLFYADPEADAMEKAGLKVYKNRNGLRLTIYWRMTE